MAGVEARGRPTIHAEVTRVRLSGVTNRLEVCLSDSGWTINRGSQQLSKMTWESQQEATEIACQWIDLQDQADAVQRQASELEVQASRLMAHRADLTKEPS